MRPYQVIPVEFDAHPVKKARKKKSALQLSNVSGVLGQALEYLSSSLYVGPAVAYDSLLTESALGTVDIETPVLDIDLSDSEIPF